MKLSERLAIRTLAMAIALFLFAAALLVWFIQRDNGTSSGAESHTGFFPPGSLHDIPDLDSFTADWYSGQLTALQEPSLYAMREESEVEIYRFLWLRTFDHPVAVRIVCGKGGDMIVSKMCDGAGGYEPGSLIANKSVAFPSSQKASFDTMLESAGFWNLPSADPDSAGLDGSQWIVEAVKDGEYHIVDRWSPKSGAVRDLGLFFLKAGGFDDEKVY